MQELINKAIEKYNYGLTDEAIKLANMIIKKQPNNYIGYKILGILFNSINRKDLAKRNMIKAEKINPNDHENLNNIAVLFYEEKDNFKAIEYIKKAILLDDLNSVYWANAGNIFNENKDYLASKEAYLRSIKINPNNENANINLAQAIANIETVESAERYLAKYLKEKNIKAVEIMANIFYRNNYFDKAFEYFKINYTENKSISSAINMAKIHIDSQRNLQAYELLNDIKNNNNIVKFYDEFIVNYLTICMNINKFKEGISTLDIDLVNSKDLIFAALAGLYYKVGQINKSIDYYEKSIKFKNNNWTVRSNYLLSLSHSNIKSPAEIHKLHLKYGEDLNNYIKENSDIVKNIYKKNDNLINIGFISADFKEHPVMKFILPVLININKCKFSIYIYDNNLPAQSKLQDIVKINSKKYTNIFNRNDEEVNDIILSDCLDIIIDLSGHTAGNRLPLLARRVAPIQMTWIGYPNTTGLKQIDYVICDKYNMPPKLFDEYWIEKPFYLNSAYNFETDKIRIDIDSSPCLKNGYITFASFNRSSKINEECLRVWSIILHNRNNSILKIANVEDQESIDFINKILMKHGIERNRIIYLYRLPIKDYLEIHNTVDLILDTWPYTGGTTTYYAIWMGVPVIALSGDTRVANQSASILKRQNLDCFISDTIEEYISIALKYTDNFEFLNTFRINSRNNWINNKNNDLSCYINDFESKIISLINFNQ